jgi:hypothetical protein
MTSPNSTLNQVFASEPEVVCAESLLRSRAASMADLAAAVTAAQAAGDLAYAFAKAAGVSLPEQAIAYHVAFADAMREQGLPMPCPCDLCTGGEGGNHGH